MVLSDLGIRAANPRAKDFKISGSEGLYLLVSPNGSKVGTWLTASAANSEN